MNSFNRVTCDWHGRTKSNIAAMEGTVKIFFKRDTFMHSMCTLVNCNFQRITWYFLLLQYFSIFLTSKWNFFPCLFTYHAFPAIIWNARCLCTDGARVLSCLEKCVEFWALKNLQNPCQIFNRTSALKSKSHFSETSVCLLLVK